jgi:dinuclear metal center YbgI/SA1388 family protein
MLVQHLIALIESTAPPRLAAPWDKSGVQIASAAAEVQTMCTALDPEPETVRRAVELGAQFLLCHHPLTLSPRLPSRLDDYHDVLAQSLSHALWLYSAHTSLDANPDGPVNWLGRALGLQEMRVLEVTHRETPSLFRVPRSAPQPAEETAVRITDEFLEYEVWPKDQSRFRNMHTDHRSVQEIPLNFPVRDYGFGCIGRLPETLPWPELERTLRQLLPTGWRAVGSPPDRVSTLAYCPGSGADLARTAFARGAQIYLTGDVKYHQAQDLRDHGLTLDVGHFSLEENMMRVWSEELETRLAGDVRVVFLPGRDPFV